MDALRAAQLNATAMQADPQALAGFDHGLAVCRDAYNHYLFEHGILTHAPQGCNVDTAVLDLAIACWEERVTPARVLATLGQQLERRHHTGLLTAGLLSEYARRAARVTAETEAAEGAAKAELGLQVELNVYRQRSEVLGRLGYDLPAILKILDTEDLPRADVRFCLALRYHCDELAAELLPVAHWLARTEPQRQRWREALFGKEGVRHGA